MDPKVKQEDGKDHSANSTPRTDGTEAQFAKVMGSKGLANFSKMGFLNYPSFETADQKDDWIWNTMIAFRVVGILPGQVEREPARWAVELDEHGDPVPDGIAPETRFAAFMIVSQKSGKVMKSMIRACEIGNLHEIWYKVVNFFTTNTRLYRSQLLVELFTYKKTGNMRYLDYVTKVKEKGRKINGLGGKEITITDALLMSFILHQVVSADRELESTIQYIDNMDVLSWENMDRILLPVTQRLEARRGGASREHTRGAKE